MTAAKLIARLNPNGKVVAEVEIQGNQPMSIPKKGRIDEDTLLQLNGQSVEVEKGDGGSIRLIKCGNTILFDNSRAQRDAPAQVLGVMPPVADAHPPGAANDAVAVQSISQERARHALNAVLQWAEDDESDPKELKSYVVGMPAMILMSGFGQTCAFYKSKGGNHERVLNTLKDWLNHGDLMDFITQSSGQDYQLAQAESLVYLNWLKKFAKAYLKGEDDATTS